jgi:hypothetical protein
LAFLKNLKIDLPYQLVVPLLGTYLRNVLQDIIEPFAHPCLLQFYSHESNFGNSPDAPQLKNELRKYGICTQ